MMLSTAERPESFEFQPGRLWSLLDMLENFGAKYLKLGQELSELETILILSEYVGPNSPGRALNEDEKYRALQILGKLMSTCHQLSMPVSLAMLKDIHKNLPRSTREFALIQTAVNAELDSKKFLYIGDHLSKYYDLTLPSIITIAFPSASIELVESGNCLALGQNTASVFHAMRAAEIGMRVFGDDLQITLSKPIETADWQEILNAITPKIRDIENLPKNTPGRDERLEFSSEAAAQFRFFKNAWRVPSAHPRQGRQVFGEREAMKVFDHTLNFFLTLAIRLKE